MPIAPISDNKPIGIFLSFADRDRSLVEEIERHLSILTRRDNIAIWHRDKIPHAANAEEETKKHLDTASIFLLCISADYIASEYLYEEMEQAVKRSNEGSAWVVPIILRPCLWDNTPMATFQALPSDGRPVVSWKEQDAAFFNITTGIQTVVNEILHPRPAVLEPSTLPSLNESVTLPDQNKAAQTIIKQGKFEKEAITTNITADIPIQDLYEDQLGFKVYALAFGEFIASQETSTPLTIGIHGPWGSGKSSLMRLIQKQLDPPLTFREQSSWIVWLFFFLSTLPIWLVGRLVMGIGHRFKVKYKWFQKLDQDLVYDPDAPKTYPQTSSPASQQLRFWQSIGKRHSPRKPLNHPTVWFNAWKFDQEEQLWAALALEVLNQIQKKYHFFQRGLFGLRLAFKRFSLFSFTKAVALPLLLGLVYWIYTSYMKVLPNAFLPLFGHQIPLGQFCLWIGIIISAWIPILNIAKDPFHIDVQKAFDKPNYKDKVGFIGNFAEDFSQIVALITRPRLGWKARKLVIFIDDLDRCQAPKAADIVEGINLFLDSQGCTFVLGMDIMTVAASIETKYKDIFEKIRQDNVDMVSPGRSFLDKIIQVPFQVPPSTKEGIIQLVNAITHSNLTSQDSNVAKAKYHNSDLSHEQILAKHEQNSKDQMQQRVVIPQTPTSPLSIKAMQPDPASYKLDDVSAAIREGAHYLLENPRQIKRFVNLFRLYVYIVDARRLLLFGKDDTDTPQRGITLKRLAIWVAWSMRWPEIAKFLQEEARLSREELREYLEDISSKLEEDGIWTSLKQANDWSAYNGCVNAVTLRLEQEKNAPSDWCYLPWYQWLREKDFLKCVKHMESFWHKSDVTEEDDLHSILTLNRATFSTNAGITTTNNEISIKTGKLAE